MNQQPSEKKCTKCGLPKPLNAYFMNSSVCIRCADNLLNGGVPSNVVPIVQRSEPVASTEDVSKISAMFSRLVEKEAPVKPVVVSTPVTKPEEKRVMSREVVDEKEREKRAKHIRKLRDDLGLSQAAAEAALDLRPGRIGNWEGGIGLNNDNYNFLTDAYSQLKENGKVETKGTRPGPVVTSNYRKKAAEPAKDKKQERIPAAEKEKRKSQIGKLVKTLSGLGWSVPKITEELKLEDHILRNGMYVGISDTEKHSTLVADLEQLILDVRRRAEAMPGSLAKEESKVPAAVVQESKKSKTAVEEPVEQLQIPEVAVATQPKPKKVAAATSTEDADLFDLVRSSIAAANQLQSVNVQLLAYIDKLHEERK